MSVSDPIGDMLTRIRNANKMCMDYVDIPASKMKIAIARILKEEGFIKYYKVTRNNTQGTIRVFLKFGSEREPVLNGLVRVSKPGLRKYVSKDDIPHVLGGLGISVISTSQGILTDRECRRKKIGGEVICNIW
ncbi:MAG: 30S ribosomal protein S8 [Candidatus Sumerlaeota bacterium]|nr:30S ribosomal protein S8 [Candidatus Sumerlaeota bacterium]